MALGSVLNRAPLRKSSSPPPVLAGGTGRELRVSSREKIPVPAHHPRGPAGASLPRRGEQTPSGGFEDNGWLAECGMAQVQPAPTRCVSGTGRELRVVFSPGFPDPRVQPTRRGRPVLLLWPGQPASGGLVPPLYLSVGALGFHPAALVVAARFPTLSPGV
jgi:hypothetical protein